ncbi:MAG: hypothetical protein BIFFINMI_03740 [Phycisphaerae bacterium]|nr:hypothetical protein [Phycisphaerae bacterium]
MRCTLPIMLGVVLLLTTVPTGAATYDYYVKYSGGSDANAGTSWGGAYATIQKAWNQIDTIMTAAPGGTTTFNVHLEQTTGVQAMAGADSGNDWWGYGAKGAADIRLMGGYDPSTDALIGVTNVTNASGNAIRVDTYDVHDQNVYLTFSDMVVHGSTSAVAVTGAPAPTITGLRTTFISDSSTSPVVSGTTTNGSGLAQLTLDRSVVQGGNIGISLSSGSFRSAIVTMTNSVVTGQSGTGAIGIYLGTGENTIGNPTVTVLHLLNSTISNVGAGGGTGVQVNFSGYDYNLHINASLDYVLFDNVGTAIEFLENSKDQNLNLAGSVNAFYDYATLTSQTNPDGDGIGVIVNNLVGSLTAPAGSAMLDADGYHLLAGSPVIDAYTLSGGDPTVDIDGDARPLGAAGDIGADEVLPVPEPATLGLLGLGGLSLLGASHRRRSRTGL